MSDYLTNLAARALAPVPAIVPRQGSLFEPVAARIGPALRQPADELEGGRDESIEVELQPAAARPRLFPTSARPADLPVEPAAQSPATVSPPPTPMPHPREVPTVVATAARITRTESIVPGPAIESPPAPAFTPAPRLRPVAVHRARPDQDVDESPREEPTPQEARRVPRRRAETTDADGDSGDSQRKSQRSSGPIREPFAPTVVIAPPPRHEPATAAPSHEPAAPSTIRITIGRIEVRAVSPPAAGVAAPRSASRPRLSLEDYLQERSGGRR